MGCPTYIDIYANETKHVQVLSLSKAVKANTKLSDDQTKEPAKNKILARSLDDKIDLNDYKFKTGRQD
jgi:hypothetical protein